MDTSIRRVETALGAAHSRRTLAMSTRPTNMVFASGDVNAVRTDLGDRRFAVVGAQSATIASLRKAIIDCAHQATAAEPADSDRRLHSFIAKLSGTMEGLGERELDAVLWNLMATKGLATVSASMILLDEIDRQPAADEQLGMDWWNNLTEERRAHWLAKANSAAPFAAWQAFRAAENDLATEG